MLAFPRPTRVVHRLSLHARALTTTTHNAGSGSLTAVAEHSSSGSPTANNTETEAAIQPWRTRHVAESSAECMVVYPWNGIRSSAEGFAIARAVQDKYGPAKEVVFPRDPECASSFQHYFWLVFDNLDVRKRLPEASAQISVQVADMPRNDGNVGLEEMMRGLGLSTKENKDAPRESSTETVASEDVSDTPPGYKALDVRVEWAVYGPGEVLKRKRLLSRSFPNKKQLPHFAAAWLAFDGFSPESARGANTPNLIRAHEKWRNIASETSSAVDGDDHFAATATSRSTAGVTPSQDPISADTESEPKLKTQLASTSETQTQEENEPPPREWIPIVPRNGQRPTPMPTSTHAAPNEASTFSPTSTSTSTSTSPSLDPTHTADILNATDSAKNDDGFAHALPKAAPAAAKMSRRDRILHLARQHARTPLPESAEEHPKPPLTEAAEKVDGDEESERHVKERTIRERLWRLVGGNY